MWFPRLVQGLSHETIANITDAVLESVTEWQNRPLEEFYPVVYRDAIRVKVRDNGHVRQKAAHIAVGVDLDGIKHVLGIWVENTEGASFWAHVCAELANRGVRDVLIVCCDGLTGLPEAIEATWPDSLVQTCVVHVIRASQRFVAYGDRKRVARELKVIYTTNAIESLNYQLRKVTKNRSQFPNNESVVKLLWLAICTIEDKRARERQKQRGTQGTRKASGRLIEGQTTTHWNQALAQLATTYPDRINPYL